MGRANRLSPVLSFSGHLERFSRCQHCNFQAPGLVQLTAQTHSGCLIPIPSLLCGSFKLIPPPPYLLGGPWFKLHQIVAAPAVQRTLINSGESTLANQYEVVKKTSFHHSPGICRAILVHPFLQFLWVEEKTCHGQPSSRKNRDSSIAFRKDVKLLHVIIVLLGKPLKDRVLAHDVPGHLLSFFIRSNLQ